MFSAFSWSGRHRRLKVFWAFPWDAGSTWPIVVPFDGHLAVPRAIVASFR
jgi:hypothetical protein